MPAEVLLLRYPKRISVLLAMTLASVPFLTAPVGHTGPVLVAPAPGADTEQRIAYAGTDHRSLGLIQGAGAEAAAVPFLGPGPDHFDDEVSARGAVVTWVSRRDAATTEVYVRRGDGPPTRVTRNTTDESRPVLSPDATRIAFSSTVDRDDGGHDIFVIGVDGTGARRVTDGTGDNTWPTWSPDGAILAFAGRRGGDDQDQIYRVPVAGGTIERVTAEAAGAAEPAWDPNPAHDRIAYTASAQVWLTSPRGTGRAPLLPAGWQSRQASWTADGSTVAFVSRTLPDGTTTGATDRVYSVVVQEDVCQCVVVPRLADNRDPSHPTWYAAPGGSGESLLVARASAPDRNTVTLQDIRPDGSDPRDLRFPILREDPGARADSRLMWEPVDGDPWFERQVYSPDGRHIAVTRFDTVDGVRVERIWIVNADGTEPRLLPMPHRRVGDRETDPAWAPDGTKLALVRSAPGSPARIEVVDARTGTRLLALPIPPALARYDDTQPAWSPDGTRLAFTRGTYRGEEQTHIWTANAADGLQQTDLTAVVCGADCTVFDDSAAFAPDGARIAFNRELDGLVLTNVDGSGCRMLFPTSGASCAAPVPQQEGGPYQPRDVAWAPDGQRIAFSSRRAADGSSPEALRIYDLADGTVRPLTTSLPGRQKEPTWRPAPPPPPGSPADPAVGVSVAPNPSYVGGAVTVTYLLRNAGGTTATGLRVRAGLPGGVPVGATGAGCATEAGCPVPDLAPGATASVRLTLTPAAALTATVRGTVGSTGGNANPANDTATATLRVLQPRIVAVPAIGPPGFVPSIRGVDFPPGVPVRLSWSLGITAAAAPVVPAADGTFTAQLLVLPKDRLGAREVVATGAGFRPVRTPFLVILPAQQPPSLLQRAW